LQYVWFLIFADRATHDEQVSFEGKQSIDDEFVQAGLLVVRPVG
jgi:hypothetical protein